MLRGFVPARGGDRRMRVGSRTCVMNRARDLAPRSLGIRSRGARGVRRDLYVVAPTVRTEAMSGRAPTQCARCAVMHLLVEERFELLFRSDLCAFAPRID